MYSALIEGRYWWLDGRTSYFPVFNNLFRKNDKYENYEAQTNQAAGIFLSGYGKIQRQKFIRIITMIQNRI